MCYKNEAKMFYLYHLSWKQMCRPNYRIPRVSAVECLNPQVSFQQSSKQLPDQQRKNQVLSSY